MVSTPLQKFSDSIQKQIIAGDINLALDRLRNYISTTSPDLQNELILLIARFNRLVKKERQGTITTQEFEVELNKLIKSVLDFLKVLPQKVNVDLSPLSSPILDINLAIPNEVGLEKIIGVNNLKQIAWIEQAIHVAKCVCRIITPSGLGSGFLISKDLLMTNHHVISNQKEAEQSIAEFNYQLSFKDKEQILPTTRYGLDNKRFYTNQELDFTIVGLLDSPDKPDLERWGSVVLNTYADPVKGEHISIIQHPNGGPKQIVLTANQVVNLWDHRIHYTTDTMPGSSGSPVFNDLWQVIAIHHAGGDLKINAKGDKRFINEGILMSAIKANAGEFWP